MDPRWGDTFSTEQTNHCSPTCTLIVCGCNDNACSPEQSYCLIMMMMCSVREKTSCTGILKRRGTLARSCSPDLVILFYRVLVCSFFFLDSKQQLFIIILFYIVFFVFLVWFFGNETAFNCALMQCAWICRDTMGTLWSLSCHWHLLMKPIPIPIPTHLWADPHLAYQWLPAQLALWKWKTSLSSKLSATEIIILFSLTRFIMPQSCTLGLKNGLGTLALVFAGCHRLMKAVWTLDHAAVISAYLCIRRASSVYARLHGCGYSSFSYSVCVRECVRARSYVRACMHTSV